MVRYDGLEDFRAFLEVDLNQKPATVREHLRYVRRFLEGTFPETKEGIRSFLLQYSDRPPSKSNAIKALRRYFRDFLGKPGVVEGFRIPAGRPSLLQLPSKAQLGAFHGALPLKHQAVFLLLASSGLRKGEVLSLSRGAGGLGKEGLGPKNSHRGH